MVLLLHHAHHEHLTFKLLSLPRIPTDGQAEHSVILLVVPWLSENVLSLTQAMPNWGPKSNQGA